MYTTASYDEKNAALLLSALGATRSSVTPGDILLDKDGIPHQIYHHVFTCTTASSYPISMTYRSLSKESPEHRRRRLERRRRKAAQRKHNRLKSRLSRR
jgi:hypothetical protein